MKKSLLLAAFFAFSVVSVLAQEGKKKVHEEKKEEKASEAKKDTLLPYQKNPKLPAFNIRLADSNTIFNTYNIPAGKPVILMFFMPDCKHCIRTVKGLVRGMDSIKNIQFYLVTPMHDYHQIREFIKEEKLENYKNIRVVGRDYEFFYQDFYGIKSVPDMALYDEHKNLIRLFEGETTVAELYKYVH